jgi:DNA transposition AAA+ family ATPase
MNTDGAAPGVKQQEQPDAALIERLKAHKERHGLTDNALGKLLGVSGTMVNRAVNGVFKGNAQAFAARAADFLHNDPARRQAREEVFDSGATRAVRDFLETVRRTGDVGLAFSPAGRGKTMGIRLYLADNPLAVGLELADWSHCAAGLERALLAAVDGRGWKRNRESRGEYLAARFRGSRRLIVADNAHKLTAGARRWLFDFHDFTGCPVALVGNPELLDAIRQNDQQFSRVGLRREIRGGKPADDAASMLRLHWPEAGEDGELLALAVVVIREQGHVRALHKQLELAKDIHGNFDTPAEAFRAAHTQLIRDYKLEEGK